MMLLCFCCFVLFVLLVFVLFLISVWVVVFVLLKVMLFNVCILVDIEVGKCWFDCCDVMVKVIFDVYFVVIGIQELVQEQVDYFVEYLFGYCWFGEGCRGGSGDEYMGVFYDSKVLVIEELGNFWLFDMFDVFGSIIWGNLYLCMVIWVLFCCIGDGCCFYFMNIYLFYCDEDEL